MLSKAKHKIGNIIRIFYPLPANFGSKKIEDRFKYKDDYKLLAKSLDKSLTFKSAIDVGCAQGLLLEPLLKRGYDITGVEVSESVADYMSQDLLKRVRFGDFSEASGQFDLVCCVEVAEHIRPSRSEELVSKLCNLSNKFIFFTAAPPGQDGHGHINCRPHREWKNLFENENYKINDKLTKKLKKDLSNLEEAVWLKKNSMIFERKMLA